MDCAAVDIRPCLGGGSERVYPNGKIIAVSELTYSDGRPSTDGKVVAERLTTAMANTKIVTMVERSKIEQVLGELKVQRSGAVDPESVSDIGMLLGANLVIVGTLTDIGQHKLEVDLRMVEVETGQIAAGTTGIVRKNWVTPEPPAEHDNTAPISLGALLKHQEPAAPAAEATPTEQIKLGDGCNSDVYYEPDGTFIRRQKGTTGKGVPIRNEESVWCNFVAYIDIVVRNQYQNLRPAWLAYKQANGL
jgi:hypothetical protein